MAWDHQFPLCRDVRLPDKTKCCQLSYCKQRSNYNEENVEIDLKQVSSGLDSDSGCSPPCTKKKKKVAEVAAK